MIESYIIVSSNTIDTYEAVRTEGGLKVRFVSRRYDSEKYANERKRKDNDVNEAE